jgi:hypothetical protein
MSDRHSEFALSATRRWQVSGLQQRQQYLCGGNKIDALSLGTIGGNVDTVESAIKIQGKTLEPEAELWWILLSARLRSLVRG